MEGTIRKWGGVIAAVVMLANVLASEPVQTSADNTLTGLTSNEIVEQMGLGWNLGNTFDATGGNREDIYSQEQSWGNPIVTKELIAAVKENGFTTIRIPVTWYKHLSDDGSYTIDQQYLDRVHQVVDYAYEEDMFIILNIHHEEWLNAPELETDYERIGVQLSAIWAQLAEEFAGYDQHLIFEGMNEPRMAGTDLEWTGNQEAYGAVNYLNQVFVNTVRRCEKGYNGERCLMIPGYAASSSATVLESIALPTYQGEVVNNLIISVHCYAPYNFCLSDAMREFDPEDSACVGEIDTLFSNLQTVFLNNNIPVVIGETSATSKDNVKARENWAYYMGCKSAAYGVPLVIWDNGADTNSGGESHAHMNRSTNTLNYPTVISKLLEGINSMEWGSGKDVASEVPGDNILDGTVIWSDAGGLESKSQWDNSYIAFGSKASFYAEGREVAFVYSGEGEPKMVLDSAAKNVWWIPVDPDRMEELGDKKVAYFGYDNILSEMKKLGVDAFADLRNMTFVATNNNIITYEIALVGGEPVVTYKVNGADYYIGTEFPDEPAVTNMQFAGWYTTKDYQAGTEYTGETVGKDITVYAKLSLNDGFDKLQEDPDFSQNVEEVTQDEVQETEGEAITESQAEKEQESESGVSDKDDSKNPGWGIPAIVIAIAVLAVGAAALLVVKRRTKR